MARRFSLILLVWALLACSQEPQQRELMTVTEVLGGDPAQAYARAHELRQFRFPKDHGAHPRFRSEWWYLTGNLQDPSGHRFGFQITFFRFALSPQHSKRPSRWASNQAWMAHFGLTDVTGAQHYSFERLARGAAGLAGAELTPLRVWLDDWQLISEQDADFPWQLRAREKTVGLDLTLTALKPFVLQGEDGLSQKSAKPGNASYYYSNTRLAARGTVRVGETRYDVDGTAWLDREWSTSALDDDQEGWDWFALQFHDGSELMYYQLRRRDGTPDPHSQGLIVQADGATRRLSAEDIELEALDYYVSPNAVRYPVQWHMTIKPLGRHIRIAPVLYAQEMDLGVRYWEGAVDVFDAQSRPTGWGYLELAGYGTAPPSH